MTLRLAKWAVRYAAARAGAWALREVGLECATLWVRTGYEPGRFTGITLLIIAEHLDTYADHDLP